MTTYKVPASDHAWSYDVATGQTCCSAPAMAHEAAAEPAALPPGWWTWRSPEGVDHAVPGVRPCATCGRHHDKPDPKQAAAGLPDYLHVALADADKVLGRQPVPGDNPYMLLHAAELALRTLASAVRRHGTEQARKDAFWAGQIRPGAFGPALPENLAAWDGSPRLPDEQVRTYLRRVRAGIEAGETAGPLEPWLTDTCPDCDAVIVGDGIVEGEDPGIAHVLIAGAVVIGCAGTRVIPPARVGLPAGDWQDWRDSAE
jgi:hypothetical protein